MGIPKVRCKIAETKTIAGLSPKQRDRIKKDLTFDNPAYASALKFSRNPEYITVPEFLHIYKRVNDNTLEVPINYREPFKVRIIRDKRVEVPIKYPKWKINLRKDQQTAMNSYIKNPDNGILVLPTGGGKTVLGLACASKMKQKVLIITGRNDLIRSWIADAELLLGIKKSDIGLIQGNSFKVGKHITIGTVQTLSKRDLSKIRDTFGMVILDECHHTPAKTYTEVLSGFRARYRIGLTATLEREDGLTRIAHHYLGNINFQKNESDDILPVEVRLIDTDFEEKKKIKRVRKYGKMVDEEVPLKPEELLRQVISNKKRNNLILDFVEGSAQQGNNCVVFTHRVKHAEHLYRELRRRRLPVALLTGNVKNRDEVFSNIEKGKIRISVATFHLVKEGINIKAWNRGFAVTPTANRTENVQAIGRIRRTAKGKKNCYWYDFRDMKVKKFRYHANKRVKYWRELKANIVELG